MATVKGQSRTLLVRLQVVGSGTAAAAGRRDDQDQEKKWRRARQPMLLSGRQGTNIILSILLQRAILNILVNILSSNVLQ